MAIWYTLEALKEVNRPDQLDWRLIGSVRKAAWKTGTSYGFRDAWAVGMIPAYTIGVWAGNAEGEGVAFDAPSFSVYGVNYSKPAEEAAVNNEVRVDLSSVDTMAAATVEGKGVTLSISDLLEGRDDAVQSDVDGQVDTQAFAREAKVAASADVQVADGQITLSADAMERATVSLQVETTDISDDYITTVTTHTVDIVLSDYAGRTEQTSGDGVTVTALGENSLPADAKASVAENVEVPQSVEGVMGTNPSLL